MRIFSYFVDAGKTIMTNKMRSGLSTLGIVIGMTAVVVMMAIGQGMQNSVKETMGDMTKNKLTINSDGNYNVRDDEKNQQGAYVQAVKFDTAIVEYIQHYFPELKGGITYQINAPWEQLTLNKKTDSVMGVWVPAEWFTINEKELVQGNFFTEKHYQENAFVAIVNYKFWETYFKNKNPIGQTFTFSKKKFTIVGVLKEEDMEWNNQIYFPDTTVSQRITHKNEISSFEVILPTDADNALWKNRITYLLLKKFNKTSVDTAGFSVSTFADMIEQINSSISMIRYFLLVMGAISLLVGGIGVMNIMIVSVTERTREIWIRKAIWALNRDIILQFLIESVVITFIGGIIAFILSYGICHLINSMGSNAEGGGMGLSAEIDQKVIILTFTITALTGIIFGILPARKAAKLKPIDALRFE